MTRRRFDFSRKVRMASLTELLIMVLAGGLLLGMTVVLLFLAARFGPLLALVALEPFAGGLCLLKRARRSWRDWARMSRTYLTLDSFGLELCENGTSTSVLYEEIVAVHPDLRLELDQRPDLIVEPQLDHLDELRRQLEARIQRA